MSAISTTFTRIPYPNRPIASLVLGVLLYLPCLIPFLPAWLHYLFISSAFGMVIDDIISWPVVQFANIPYVYATKKKWLKNTLQIISIVVGAYLGYSFIVGGFTPYVGFITFLLNIVRQDYILGVIPFALSTVASIILVDFYDKNYNKSQWGNLQCIFGGMIGGQIMSSFLLPYLMAPLSLHADMLFCGTMVGMFSMALATKLVSKMIFYVLLGHSNSDGQCFMNEDHWLSRKIGLRQWLYQRQVNRVRPYFKKDIDIEQLFTDAFQMRTTMKATKLRKNRFNMLFRFFLFLGYDEDFKDLRNAPLKSLANIRSTEDAQAYLQFIERFPKYEEKDRHIFFMLSMGIERQKIEFRSYMKAKFDSAHTGSQKFLNDNLQTQLDNQHKLHSGIR